MKIEILKDSIQLTPEDEHEKQALEKIAARGVKSVEFDDSWSEDKWPLILRLHEYSW